MNTAPTDAELVALVLSGDLDAFTFIVTRYKKLVFSVALELLHDYHDAEDVTIIFSMVQPRTALRAPLAPHAR